MYSDMDDRVLSLPGSPIRISLDHSLLSAPQSFSQINTSFIACRYQGIHRAALNNLTTKNFINILSRKSVIKLDYILLQASALFNEIAMIDNIILLSSLQLFMPLFNDFQEFNSRKKVTNLP